MPSGLHPRATELTSNAARRERDERERDLVADPEAAKRTMAALLADELPARERRVFAGFRRTYAAYSRRDWEINTLLIAPEHFVFRSGDLRESLPDARESYSGIEGYLEAQELLISAWPDLSLELVELLACGREAVVTLVRFRGTAARSGLELDWHTIVENRFDGGETTAQRFWFDLDAGAAELGLEVPPVARAQRRGIA